MAICKVDEPETIDENACTFDSECPGEKLCDGEVSGTCVDRCVDDSDCAPDERCRARNTDASLKLCVPS
jgi:hypothetical protein